MPSATAKGKKETAARAAPAERTARAKQCTNGPAMDTGRNDRDSAARRTAGTQAADHGARKTNGADTARIH